MRYIKALLRGKKNFEKLFGLKKDEFEDLSSKLEVLWEEERTKRLMNRERKRIVGGGRKEKLCNMEDKLFLTLFYYRYYPTHLLLGFLFGIDQSTATRLLAKMHDLIEKAADPCLKTRLENMKSNKERVSGIDVFMREHPELSRIIIDTTEQRCNRPKEKEKRKAHCSGRKKAYTIKTQITTTAKGEIIDVSCSYPGSTHDKPIVEQEGTIEMIPDDMVILMDKGYQGIKKDYPSKNIFTPIKRRGKNSVLSESSEEFNKNHSSKRIYIEHAFGRMKKYAVLGNVYRGCTEVYNQVFRSIAALVNFKEGYGGVY